MAIARSSRVVPIPFEVLIEEGDDNAYELVPSRELKLPLPHLPPIKDLGVHNSERVSGIPHIEATAENVPSNESIDGESTHEADPKGKRFLPWISCEGSASTAEDNVTGDTCKGGLLAYFKDLAFSVEDINFATIDHYLENGSDINATSSSTGGNIMHEIAAHWDKNVADYLLKRGLNIHLKDKDGRTPLHVAASANHVEIIEWLADQGVELTARTNVEEQTPLHHATRYDSVQAIQTLINKGGDCEMVDYKGRTSLHLAAELDRTAAVERLISAPILADVRVQDHMGNRAIASMIQTMPQMALLALDQLHRIVPAKRKQYFLLNHLEPEVEVSCNAGVKTPFEVAVEEKRRNILSHPVMQTLIAQKWKFMQWVFYIYLAAYMVFLLSWTLLIAFPSVQEKHEYVFPRDIWRIVVSFIAVVTYILQIVEEVVEVVFSKNQFKDYRKLRTKMLQDDLNNCAYVEERQFFECEIVKLHRTKPSYFLDPWNLIDLVTYALMFVLIFLHISDIIFHSTTFALWVARVSCFVLLLIWFRLFKHARGFRIFGPLVAIITQSLGDISRFFILYAILLVPYVVCFWVLFGGSQSAGLSSTNREDLTAFYRVAIMMIRMGLVDDYPYSSIRSIDEAMAAILVLSFLVFIAVVGLNLFIALLSDTFQRVYDNAQSIALLEQAKLILSYEGKMCACFINRYLEHIHKNCSPHTEFYDDDERFSKEPSTEVKKITHQIHNIVSDLHASQRNDSEINVQELRGLSEVFADFTDQQDSKLAHITQQLEKLEKVLNRTGRAEVAQASAAQMGNPHMNTAEHKPTSYPQGSFTSIHPSMVHGSRGRQAWEQATSTESAGATSLSPPSHPHMSPTRMALQNVFRQHPEQAHFMQPLPARKHSFVASSSQTRGPLPATGPRNSDVLSLEMYQRSKSSPGTSIQPGHRRVKKISVHELEEMQWERKSQPMQRRSNAGT